MNAFKRHELRKIAEATKGMNKKEVEKYMQELEKKKDFDKKVDVLMGEISLIKMHKHKRKQNIPKWKDPDFPPRRKRNIVFWLMDKSTEDMYIRDIFFVNDTDEVLDVVSAENTGFFSTDDETVGVNAPEGYVYKKVKPGEAVKVDSYDIMYDSDFVLILDIYVKSKKLGERHYRESYKGSLGTRPLEYYYEDEKDKEKLKGLE